MEYLQRQSTKLILINDHQGDMDEGTREFIKWANGSDGVGNWWRVRPAACVVRFRKMLFDRAGVNSGDLHVTGILTVNDGELAADWHIEAVDASTGAVLSDLGTSTSEGTRLS